MIDKENAEELRIIMLRRRREILAYRDSLQSSYEPLQERDNEMEEMAEKETLVEGLGRLDHRAIDELRGIDAAIHKMEKGTYGRCENCNRAIAAKRLQAIPWAAVCKRCAQELETQRDEALEGEDLAPESLSDQQMVEAIWDELDTKDDVDTAALEIQCDNGTVQLTGSLATEQEHQLVLEAVEETLGFDDLIDRIDVQELKQAPPWEESADEAQEEALLEGEAAQQDPFSAQMNNESMVPPDRLVPEDDR